MCCRYHTLVAIYLSIFFLLSHSFLTATVLHYTYIVTVVVSSRVQSCVPKWEARHCTLLCPWHKIPSFPSLSPGRSFPCPNLTNAILMFSVFSGPSRTKMRHGINLMHDGSCPSQEEQGFIVEYRDRKGIRRIYSMYELRS